MSTPKQSPKKNLAQRIEASEVEHRAKVASVLKEISEAGALLAKIGAEIVDADDHLAEIEGQLKRGVDDVSADDLSAAEFEVKATNFRLAGAKTRLARLKASNVNTQTDAAQGLVETVRKALPMVPVHTTSAPVPEIAEDEAPVLIVRQTKASLFSDGRLATDRQHAGIKDVEISLARSIIHKEPTYHDMNKAAAKVGAMVEFQMGVRSRKMSENLWVDTFKATSAQNPEIPAVIDTDLRHDGPAAALARNIGVDFARRSIGMIYDSSLVESVTATDRDGLRTIEIMGRSKTRRPMNPGPAVGTVRDSPSRVGSLHFGLGRVTEVTDERLAQDEIRWTARLVSRTSWDTPCPEQDDDAA